MWSCEVGNTAQAKWIADVRPQGWQCRRKRWPKIDGEWKIVKLTPLTNGAIGSDGMQGRKIGSEVRINGKCNDFDNRCICLCFSIALYIWFLGIYFDAFSSWIGLEWLILDRPCEFAFWIGLAYLTLGTELSGFVMNGQPCILVLRKPCAFAF